MPDYYQYPDEDNYNLLSATEMASDGVLFNEKEMSFERYFVELLFYTVVIILTFPSLTGLRQIRFGMGGLLLFTGLIGFFLLLKQPGKLPISLRFGIVMAIGANFSQVLGQGQIPLIGAGLNSFTLWISSLTLICYLFQNHAQMRRGTLFLIGILLVSIMIGGLGGFGEERLALERGEESAGLAFANSNELAYMSGVLSISCLYWSFMAKKTFRPVLWFLAAFLVLIIFKTVSRSGVTLFGCGLAVLITGVLLGKGMRLNGIVLIIIGFFVVLKFGHLVASNLLYLRERAESSSRDVRAAVYSLTTLKQMMGTLLMGDGIRTRVVGVGIIPHNTFINMHLSFGGITSLPYLAWMVTMGLRVLRMVRIKEIPANYRFLTFSLYGMNLGIHLFTNQGFMLFSSLFSIAVIERYAGMYSKKYTREIKYLLEEEYLPEEAYQVSDEDWAVSDPQYS